MRSGRSHGIGYSRLSGRRRSAGRGLEADCLAAGNRTRPGAFCPSVAGNECQTACNWQQTFAIRGGNRLIALVFQAGCQADDDIAGIRRACGRLGGGSVWFAEEFQSWNMDHPRKLPAARVGVDQRREQLHQRQKAEDCDAGSSLHNEADSGRNSAWHWRRAVLSIEAAGLLVKP